MDNINFYSNWIPAWQQTDSYTTQPWCLLSKNVDIFSSSKSIKATAWSEPISWELWEWIVDVDERWRLELRDNWVVYDRLLEEVVVNTSTNFQSYQVSYTWKWWQYSNAVYWTPKKLFVEYVWDNWVAFTVFTDRTQYTYTRNNYVIEKSMATPSWMNYEWIIANKWYWYVFQSSSPSATKTFEIKIPTTNRFTSFPLKIFAEESASSTCHISLQSIKIYKQKYYYDPEIDWMIPDYDSIQYLSWTWSLLDENWVSVNVPLFPYENSDSVFVRIEFRWTRDTWFTWDWEIYIDFNWWEDESHRLPNSSWDINYYYSYLPIKDYSKFIPIWDYYWIKWYSFQPFYRWTSKWVRDNNWPYQVYDFSQYMWWVSDTDMDVITLIEYKEMVYMIGNMNGNWYIIPCDLSWGRWVATMFPWIQFLGGINKDYLIYLCWTDRWVSTLWAYNWQELVPVISWSQEMSSNDLIDYVEQYRFDGSIVIYRNNIVLGTTDNRLFRYWQTYWGRWGSFIYVLPSWATLDRLEAIGNDLRVFYILNQTKYVTTYQDDVPIQRFNTEYEVVYPIVIWNHILEKEDTDLYVSYLLPSANTSLEFWAMNNHYQYWTFTSEENVTLDTTKNYTMAWAWWTYALKFIERNWNQYTFELDGNLPVQTSNEMKIKDNENTVVLNYTSYNHFRLIWTLSTDKCEESKFRFTGLNNKLNLTKTHSMQIMVKGKWTTQYTPELFALNLVATQRDRW